MGIGGQALVIFIDYSKAFDSISHVQLFYIMLELGFPEHIVALLQSLYIDQTAVIRWNGSTTDTFPIGIAGDKSSLCWKTFNVKLWWVHSSENVAK